MRSSWTFASACWPGRRRGTDPWPGSSPSNGTTVPSASSTARASTSSAGGRHTEAQVEAERVDVVGLAQGDAVGLPLPGEQLLRQRRPVVGQVLLGADQRDRARRSRRCAASRTPATRPARRRRRRRAPRPRRHHARPIATVPAVSVPVRRPTTSTRWCGSRSRQRQRVHRARASLRRRPADGHAGPASAPAGSSPGRRSSPSPTPRSGMSVFAAIGRVEPMALTSELSIRFLRPAAGDVLWAACRSRRAGRRNVVGTVRLWTDDRVDKPTAVAQGTYALPADPSECRQPAVRAASGRNSDGSEAGRGGWGRSGGRRG